MHGICTISLVRAKYLTISSFGSPRPREGENATTRMSIAFGREFWIYLNGGLRLGEVAFMCTGPWYSEGPLCPAQIKGKLQAHKHSVVEPGGGGGLRRRRTERCRRGGCHTHTNGFQQPVVVFQQAEALEDQ